MKRKVLISLLVVVMVLAFSIIANALPVPDIGVPDIGYEGDIYFNSSTGEVTKSTIEVNYIKYLDGTADYSTDTLIGKTVWIDNILNPTVFKIGDYNTTSYFSATVDHYLPKPMPTGGTDYELFLKDININNSIDSRVLTEFNDVISQMHVVIRAEAYGLRFPNGHVKGDVYPTPEPATLLLFGSGLSGLGLIGWRRKRR